MFITVGDKEVELSTKLGVAAAIEKKFKMPLTQVFGRIGEAEIPELTGVLSIAAGKTSDPSFAGELLDNWDYIELQTSVQLLLAKLMFSGTHEQVESKLEKFPASDEGKNAIRELLGLPKLPSTSTASN